MGRGWKRLTREQVLRFIIEKQRWYLTPRRKREKLVVLARRHHISVQWGQTLYLRQATADKEMIDKMINKGKSTDFIVNHLLSNRSTRLAKWRSNWTWGCGVGVAMMLLAAFFWVGSAHSGAGPGQGWQGPGCGKMGEARVYPGPLERHYLLATV